MKCDNLIGRTFDGEVYVLASEAMEAIAELKAKVDELSFDKKLLESHWKDEEIRCESASRNCIELSNENAKLVSKIELLKVWHRQGIANLKFYYKQKLEDVKATAYAESVDAGMENRKLKRALWLARARSAHNAAMMWEVLSDEYLIGALFTIDFRCIGDPDVTEFQMFRTCIDWMKIYENAEHKCLKKAEEYK